MTETTIAAQPVPLTRLPDGTWRVTGTRISLDLVIESFKDGETPEGIVDCFDSLRLADVYALISYYLNHTAEVEAYLRKREADAKEIRRKIEATQPWRAGFRERLLARQARMEAEKNAPLGQ